MNVWVDDQGVWVSVSGAASGMTFLIPASMTISAIQNNLREIEEWLS